MTINSATTKVKVTLLLGDLSYINNRGVEPFYRLFIAHEIMAGQISHRQFHVNKNLGGPIQTSN